MSARAQMDTAAADVEDVFGSAGAGMEDGLASTAPAFVADEPGISMLTLGLSLLLPLLLIALFFLRGSRSSSSLSGKVMLFGPMGAGKTSLYLRLRYGRVGPTVTSTTATSATFAFHGHPAAKPVELVEVPGSGRLRAQLLEEAASAAVLVCVLDGTQLASQCKEAAGILFDVLSLEAVQNRTPPLVIAVNKSDQRVAALAVSKARGLLEAELQSVRLARTTMQDTSEKRKRLRGIEDASRGSFSFDHLGGEFGVVGTSAAKGDVGEFCQAVGKYVR